MSASPELGVPPAAGESGGTAARGGTLAVLDVPVGDLSQIPLGEGRAFDAAGHQVAVLRLRSGEVRALQAVCPHRGGPLADGQTDARVLVCPLHLYAWDTATGCSTSDQEPVRVYPVRVQDGRVVVQVPA